MRSDQVLFVLLVSVWIIVVYGVSWLVLGLVVVDDPLRQLILTVLVGSLILYCTAYLLD